MEGLTEGDRVEHPEFGYGRITSVLGGRALVDFSGEKITVATEELTKRETKSHPVISRDQAASIPRTQFRRAFEAVNLGVVPPDSAALEELTISGATATSQIREWLKRFYSQGLCKTVFGYYGSGKSHFLRLAKATALAAGWVVSYLEFDPKAADPVKAHLVYQNLMNNLEFPARADGAKALGFFGFVKEARDHWAKVRDLKLFRSSAWFAGAFEVLQYYPHGEDQDYVSACAWLAGDPGGLTVIRKMARDQGLRPGIVPLLPRTKETAEIYTMNLAVVAEMCRAIGYRGLLFILDEAEHVRNYNVKRQERANSLFDLLARCAHLPQPNDPAPNLNDHGMHLPDFWRRGPHFGLLVGLTEADTFADPNLSLRDSCAFLFEESDRFDVKPPEPSEYEIWCENLMAKFHGFYPECSELVSDPSIRRAIANTLREEFERVNVDTRAVRTWVKLGCLVPSILMVKKTKSLEKLLEILRSSARQAANLDLPWENEL